MSEERVVIKSGTDATITFEPESVDVSIGEVVQGREDGARMLILKVNRCPPHEPFVWTMGEQVARLVGAAVLEYLRELKGELGDGKKDER